MMALPSHFRRPPGWTGQYTEIGVNKPSHKHSRAHRLTSTLGSFKPFHQSVGLNTKHEFNLNRKYDVHYLKFRLLIENKANSTVV
jgi:hypothetical protein